MTLTGLGLFPSPLRAQIAYDSGSQSITINGQTDTRGTGFFGFKEAIGTTSVLNLSSHQPSGLSVTFDQSALANNSTAASYTIDFTALGATAFYLHDDGGPDTTNLSYNLLAYYLSLSDLSTT